VRLSRPCYDKMHRCPGWAGGGLRYARRDRCDNGHLGWQIYEGRLWRWRLNRCPACAVVVLPYVVRWVDWRWIRSEIRFRWRGPRPSWDPARLGTERLPVRVEYGLDSVPGVPAPAASTQTNTNAAPPDYED
jgi:hypothetical protein